MKVKQSNSLYDLLEAKYFQYHRIDFVENDPISIPHLFSKKEDIEIAAFLASIIAWGQRITVIRNAKKILSIMDNSPYDFIVNHQPSDLERAVGFVHRTFNADDLTTFFSALQNLYQQHNGLEGAFSIKQMEMGERISNFKRLFFSIEHLKRSQKHLADPMKGSTAKRINMFLRWMVRKSKTGVDFGIWKQLDPKDLMIPLDVHTGNVGRELGLLTRKQNDWKAVVELTESLKKFDSSDPTKYDFALFGMGVNGDLSAI